ncbi:MAG: response regulator [bacterium]
MKKIHPESASRIPPRILLAEDDDEMRVLLGRALRKAGYRVVEDYDGQTLFDDLIASLPPEDESRRFDLLISDIRMPGPNVMQTLETMYGKVGFPPVILITAFGDKDLHAAAEKKGIKAVFDKPFDIDELVAKAEEVIGLTGQLL